MFLTQSDCVTHSLTQRERNARMYSWCRVCNRPEIQHTKNASCVHALTLICLHSIEVYCILQQHLILKQEVLDTKYVFVEVWQGRMLPCIAFMTGGAGQHCCPPECTPRRRRKERQGLRAAGFLGTRNLTTFYIHGCEEKDVRARPLFFFIL